MYPAGLATGVPRGGAPNLHRNPLSTTVTPSPTGLPRLSTVIRATHQTLFERRRHEPSSSMTHQQQRQQVHVQETATKLQQHTWQDLRGPITFSSSSTDHSPAKLSPAVVAAQSSTSSSTSCDEMVRNYARRIILVHHWIGGNCLSHEISPFVNRVEKHGKDTKPTTSWSNFSLHTEQIVTEYLGRYAPTP